MTFFDDLSSLAHAPAWVMQRANGDAQRTRAIDSTDESWTVPQGERHDAMVSIAGTLRHNLALTPDEIGDALRMLSESGRFGEAPADREQHISNIVGTIDWAPGKVPWEVRLPDLNGKKQPPATPIDRFKVLSVEDARRVALEPVDWVIDDLLAAGEKAVIAGPPKAMKTWLALHLCRSVAEGEDMLERQQWAVAAPQNVLFVQEEGAKQRWARRIDSVFGDVQGLMFKYTHRAGFSLLDDKHVAWTIEQALDRELRLIVLDPWQRVTPGVKEKDEAETGPAWDAVHAIASATGAAIVILHHTRKGDGELSLEAIRGSSRMAGEVDLALVLRKKDRGTLEIFIEGRDLVRSDSEDGNLMVKYHPDRPHEMRADEFKVTAKGAKNVTREAVIAVLERATGRMRTTQVRVGVAEHLDEERSRPAVDHELHVLAGEGKATKIASGKGKPTYWEWSE